MEIKSEYCLKIKEGEGVGLLSPLFLFSQPSAQGHSRESFNFYLCIYLAARGLCGGMWNLFLVAACGI